jgi:hypothetical protein
MSSSGEGKVVPEIDARIDCLADGGINQPQSSRKKVRKLDARSPQKPRPTGKKAKPSPILMGSSNGDDDDDVMSDADAGEDNEQSEQGNEEAAAAEM